MLDKSKLYISWYQAVTTLALHFSALHLWIIGNCSALNLIIAKQLLILNLLKKKGAQIMSAFFLYYHYGQASSALMYFMY